MVDNPLGRDVARRLIEELRNDPAQQAMMAEIAERHARLRANYDGVDVTTLDEDQWREWLTVHHYRDRDRAKGLRQNHRHRLKIARNVGSTD